VGGLGEHRPGGPFGVQGIGLASSSAVLAVLPVNLHDLDALADQEPGEPGTVAAGAFHPDRLELAVTTKPPQQGRVAGRRGWECGMTQQAASRIEDGGMVEVLVGVDPADDGDG
jgi:hypothetical protein